MPLVMNTNNPESNLDTSWRGVMPTEFSGVSTPTISKEQMDTISMQVYNRTHGTDVGVSTWEHIGRWASGSTIDLADTVWGSPVNPFGERGDIWAYASDEQKEYYERHKGLIEGTSAVVGGIMTAVAAEALVIPRITASIAGSAGLAGSLPIRAAKAWNESTRINMLSAQRAAAAAGESYSVFGSATGRAFLTNRVAAGVGTTTRTVPIEYAVMWNNEAFNTGDWSQEGFWIGAAAGLGGVIGVAGARSAARKVANSQEIRDLRATPKVLAGTSNALLDPAVVDRAKQLNPDEIVLKESALTTSYMLAARSADPSKYDEAAANATRLNSLRSTAGQWVMDSFQKHVASGIDGVKTVRGKVKDMPEVMNIIESVGKSDPYTVHGLAEFGVVPGSLKSVIDDRAKYVESLRTKAEAATKKKDIKEAMRLGRQHRILKQRDGFALINGSWMRTESPLAEAVSSFDHQRAAAAILPMQNTETLRLELPDFGKIRLDASLTPFTARSGDKVDVGSLSLRDRMYLNEMGTRMVNKLSAKNAKVGFKLTRKAQEDWFTLDLAAGVLEKKGTIEFADDATLRSADDIKREALRLKATAVLNEIGKLGKITPEIRFKYNLPQATAMENLDDPAGDMFRTWLDSAAGPDATVQELASALNDMRTIQGVELRAAGNSQLPRVDGDMLRFNRDKRGKWLRPVVGYFDRPSGIEKLTQRSHMDAVMQRRAERTALMVAGQTHVNELARMLVEMPEMRTAMDILGLHGDQATGIGGPVSQAVGEALPKRFLARDVPQILSASHLQEATERHGRAVFDKMMKDSKMQELVTQLTSSGNAAKRVSLDEYFSLRQGWDVDSMSEISKGRFGFELADTPHNRKRLGMSEADEWNGQLMPNERMGKPVTVDSVGAAAIDSYNKLTNVILDADNAIRRSRGMRPVSAKSFFAPSPDTKNAHVGFLFDLADKLVPGRTIVAKSQDEYDALVKRTIDEMGNGYTLRTREELERNRDIYDVAEMDWIDPGKSSATLGIGSQKGGLGGAYVKQGAFNEALEWLRSKTIAQSQDTLRQLMQEPILIARANSVAESALRTKPERNIFDMYEQMLTGRSQKYRETSIVNRAFEGVEESIDKVLASVSIAAPARYVIDLAQKLGMNPADLNGKRSYEALTKELGQHIPFKNVTEMLESQGIRQPPTVKGIAGKLNTLAASVFLRWFEVVHPVMNGLGLIAALPSTIMSGKAPISTFVNVNGENIGLLDGPRIMNNAMKRMFRRGSNEDWQHMMKNGDAMQSTIEYHQQLGAIDSQAGFNKWAKKIDTWISTLSEKSESGARQYAHFVGLEMADLHGIRGMEARHNFAREIANSMIADYAPINRPELFSSGFGSMIGLFQSYAMNHYTRMFRWMEEGQYAKVGLQAATQATMFGVPGTYNLGLLMDMRDSMNSTGSEPTAVDMIYSRFGPVLGGAIVHGGVSELTQIAFWTRGDMNFRVPGATGSLPAIEIGQKVAAGFTEAVRAYMSAMPGERLGALTEAVQREMPNRVLRSWLILLNGGKEVDAYGQVMTDTTQFMDYVARTVGARSSRQQAELEAFYAGKAAVERDSSKMERLRESFRTAVRSNNGNVVEVNPIQYFNDYVEAGGNPRLFKTWIKNLLRDSNSSRSIKNLRKDMSTPRSALEVWRFGAYGAYAVE